jgi:hypothetical protein
MKKLVLLILLGTAAVSVWSWTRSAEPVDAEPTAHQLLADRIWVDRVPRSETDTFQVLVMISEQAVGVFQATSAWRGSYEAFRYEAHGPELRLLYPQTGDREKVRAKAKRCSQDGMDFCLELDGASRGVKRYYSREGWEIGSSRDLDAVKRRIDTLRGQLASPQ